MFSIQATDCTGTALVNDAIAKPVVTLSTAVGLMLTTKTGIAPNGDRNRTYTFVVTDDEGATTTWTREKAGVRNDATGELRTAAREPIGVCACCGDDLGQGAGRSRTENGTVERLCRDCLVIETAA